MKIRWAILFVAFVVILVAGCGGKTPSVTVPPTSSTTTIAPTLTIPSPIPPSTTVTPSTTTTTTSKPSTTTTTTTTTMTTTTKAQPPATVSGLIYKRDAATSFTVNAAPAPLRLSGATVAIDADKSVTGADGTYNFTTVSPGFHTITVTKEGYLPQKVSWTFDSGKSYTFNIGLYTPLKYVTPHPGFTKGIITWDASGSLTDVYYKQGLFSPTYSAAAQNAGASLVTVPDPVFIKSADMFNVVMSTVSNAGSYWRMMNETEYTALVKDAHSKGLQFMLWLGVLDTGDTPYSKLVGGDGVREESFWDSWFSEYQKYVLQYAAMAEKLGIEYINLGHDMGYVTGQSHYLNIGPECLARWKQLINAIRSVYHGKITYFGGTAVSNLDYEDADYANGFIELFDDMGINVQSVSSQFNPSLAELKIAVGKLLDRYIDWQRPIFVMIRVPSVDGGTSFETYIEPQLAVNREAEKHAINLLQQADIYEAFFEVLSGRTPGIGQVNGIFSWGYNYLDDYLVVPDKPDGVMAMDKSANIRGKPAEAVLKYWNFPK